MEQEAPAPTAREEAKAHLERIEMDNHAHASEARRPLYEDVEKLVTIGFLSHPVRIAGMSLSLRSLGPGDQFLLANRVGKDHSTPNWKLWAIAQSIWMVDGISLLEVPHAAPMLFEVVRHLPKTTREILFSIVIGMFARTNRALSRTEAYCYEPYSRVNWRLCGRTFPARDEYVGVPGISRLGTNHIQRMWMAFNLTEDDRDEHLRSWQEAKLIASASAPKGIRKLNQTDERIHTQEETRRHHVIGRMVHLTLWGEAGADLEDQPWKVVVQGKAVDVNPVARARTPEQLEDEMRRWVAGEKDWHDIVVDTYKARIKGHFDNEKSEREEALKEVRTLGVSGGTQMGAKTRMVGYTPEQLREFRPDLSDRTQQSTKRVFDGHAPVAVYQKYLTDEMLPQAGNLIADEEGIRDQGPISPQPQPRTLQDKVVSRDLSFSTDPIGDPSVGAKRSKADG